MRPAAEVVARPDSNDTRMQQVTFANGKLWGALDTALNPDGGPSVPGSPGTSSIRPPAKLVHPGLPRGDGTRLHVSGDRRHAEWTRDHGLHGYRRRRIRVRPMRRSTRSPASVPGTTFPAARVPQADDGFSGYKQQNSRTRSARVGATTARPRWTATRSGSPASTSAAACDYTTWGGPFFVGGTGDNLLGTCGGATHGPWPAHRACELVDPDQQVHAVVDRALGDDWRAGRKAGPPLASTMCAHAFHGGQRRASRC